VESPSVCTFLAADAVASISTAVIRKSSFVFILQSDIMNYLKFLSAKLGMFIHEMGEICIKEG